MIVTYMSRVHTRVRAMSTVHGVGGVVVGLIDTFEVQQIGSTVNLKRTKHHMQPKIYTEGRDI